MKISTEDLAKGIELIREGKIPEGFNLDFTVFSHLARDGKLYGCLIGMLAYMQDKEYFIRSAESELGDDEQDITFSTYSEDDASL